MLFRGAPLSYVETTQSETATQKDKEKKALFLFRARHSGKCLSTKEAEVSSKPTWATQQQDSVSNKKCLSYRQPNRKKPCKSQNMREST